MKLSKTFKDNEELITCILLVIIGYMIAKFFSRNRSGFKIGGQEDDEYKYNCSGKTCIEVDEGEGTYITETCDDECGFACNASNVCVAGSNVTGGSGPYDTIIDCDKVCNNNNWFIDNWLIITGVVLFIFGIIL